MQTIFDIQPIVLFAQEGGGGGGALGSMLFPFLIIGVLFYFMLIRPQRREQQQVREMQEGLKKNDQVVTAGGIRGTVVNAPIDSPYVTIRVDETTNTKLRIIRSSISRLATDEDEKGGKKDAS